MAVRTLRFFSCFLVFLLLCLAAPSFAAVILSNSIDPPYENSGTAFSGQTTVKAVGVEIPAGPDYQFESFRVVLQGIGPDSLAVGRIFSDNGVDAPLAIVQTLNTALVSLGHDVYDFVSPVPFTLEAGEKYWFAITSPSDGVAFRWDRTSPSNEPSGTAGYLGYTFSSDSGASWIDSSFFNAFQLHATPVPEPTTSFLTATVFLCSILLQKSKGTSQPL